MSDDKPGADHCPDCAMESRGRWCYRHLAKIERQLRIDLASCQDELVLCWDRLDHVRSALERGGRNE